MTPLPVDEAIPPLTAALAQGNNAVLQAPPGAGKTTRVPLALMGQPWTAGRRIVMLEPRRLATRAAATFMARTLGEPVGQTVGYRMRLDSRISAATRVEVVTEGILTRLIQDDPELSGIAAIIFDEFHERSLNADLGLALCLEVQGALRPDLRLLAMSATLDGAAVAKLLGEAPLITSEGRAWPVDTRYLDKEPRGRFEDTVVSGVLRALAEEDGDLLVFLPGEAEIRRVEAALNDDSRCRGLRIAPLYGNLAQEQQDLALRPGAQRRVVLATSIAETSLTIEGVRVVVDGGLMRVPRFDPGSGMTRLETLKVSRASADQRRGRAGRLGPGVCYRMWTEPTQRTLAAQTAPEVLQADLAPLALDLAQWGVGDVLDLAWLDPPPPAAYAQATGLLHRLGALDDIGQITPHGREMARLPMHPRLAHMILRARRIGLGGLACDLAAILSERDVLRLGPGERDADLRLRVEALRGQARGLTVDRGALARAREQARQFYRQMRLAPGGEDVEHTGLVLALAYPDRLARRRPGGEPRYQLSNGRGAFFAEHEALSAEDWLAVAHLDGDKREARIFLAAPLSAADIEEHFADQIHLTETVVWDSREEAVLARRQRRLGELVLKEERLTGEANPAAINAALLTGIREIGLHALPWSREAEDFRERVAFLRRVDGDACWPDLSDAALLDDLEGWLAPFLDGMSRRNHLSRLDLPAILRAQLDWTCTKALDELAPTHVAVPSGSRVRIDYSGDEPVLAVRLQEMFGLAATPRIARGQVPLLLHLLSPARRPVQVTRDLASFWANAYRQVKADLKGQYPKHYWPDDPLQAEPTARAKPRK
jgi:ATP-dependent helicase HrpB